MAVEGLSAIEPMVRLAAFSGVFATVALWEALNAAPGAQVRAHAAVAAQPVTAGARRPCRSTFRARRSGGVGADRRGAALGAAPRLGLPLWATVVLAVIALDFAIYLQHVLFHSVPALWRVHRVHHADPDFDVTTAGRFHPIEILLSLGFKCAVILVVGAPALGVVIFEVLLNAAAMFNHANGHLPTSVDRWLRWLVVTPDMHRVHHSVLRPEMNSNFGFNLPWWDRLFGTYRAQPSAGHTAMRIGVEGLDAPEELKLVRLLTQPLREPLPSRPQLQEERA